MMFWYLLIDFSNFEASRLQVPPASAMVVKPFCFPWLAGIIPF